MPQDIRKDIISLKKRIEHILATVPKSRDDDFLLYWTLVGAELSTITTLQLLQGMSDGKYPPFESVRRTRQMLQCENVALQGKMYGKRKQRGEEVTSTIARPNVL